MLHRILVLLIDTDPAHLTTLAQWLNESDYECATGEDGLSGLRQFFSLRPDIVLVDIDVAGMSGWQVVERIRDVAETPIIVTSSKASSSSLKRALDLGVSGFLVKPVPREELLMRLNTVRDKEFNGANDPRWIFRTNRLIIDWRSCEVSVRGERVFLTGTEFKLLAYLVQRRGWVVSHEQIVSQVWGDNYLGGRNQVKLYIWYLRQKIEEDPRKPRLLTTRRGLGYSFAA